MSELEDRILRIVELRASGLDEEKIARRLGLGVTIIKMYENSAEKIIEEAISKGYRTLENIGEFAKLSPMVVDICTKIYGIKIPTEEKTGLSESTVKNYSSQERIKLPELDKLNRGQAISKGRTTSRNKKLQIIRDSLNEGVNSLEELCRRTGIKTAEGVKKYCARFGIELPENLIPYKQRPGIDSLIEKGLTLDKISKEVRLSKERVRQYINYSGQYKEYRKKREDVEKAPKIEEKILKELQGIFLSTVRARTEELAKKEGFATQKAVEYLHSYRNFHDKNYSFTFLYNLFKKYEKAKSGEVRLSLEEIGIEFGMHATRIGKIFSRISLEPIYGNRKMKVKKRNEKKEAVKRGFSLEFSGRDIAYFLGLPKYLPTIRYDSIGKRPKTQRYITYIGLKKEKSPLLLTYKLASQIYEAKDCNFKVEEIAELVKKDEVIVWYALDFRKEIDPKIIKGLRVLYKDPRGRFVKKPYLTKEMREIELD